MALQGAYSLHWLILELTKVVTLVLTVQLAYYAIIILKTFQLKNAAKPIGL